MSENDPYSAEDALHKLDYVTPGRGSGKRRPPRKDTEFQFFIGIVVGTLISALIWIFAFRYGQSTVGLEIAVAVASMKLVGGILLACSPGWRNFGAGILVSLGLGCLIFFGLCTHNISRHL